MLTEQEREILTDLCARYGIDEVVRALSQPMEGRPRHKGQMICLMAANLMSQEWLEPGTEVHVVRKVWPVGT